MVKRRSQVSMLLVNTYFNSKYIEFTIRTGPAGPSRAPVATELVVGMCMPTLPSSSLTEHLLPWLMDLERGTQILEVCDSTLS